MYPAYLASSAYPFCANVPVSKNVVGLVCELGGGAAGREKPKGAPGCRGFA